MAISRLVCKECNTEFEAKRNDAIRCPECRANRTVHTWNYEQRHSHPCPDCGRPCTRKSIRCHSCDTKKRNGERRGIDSPSWKGGRVFRKHDGYWEVRIDGERVLEHRYIWEQANGPLPKNWVVHHLNGIKDDNRLENLVGMSRSHHGPRAHIDPTVYEARIRDLEARLRELES